MLLSISSQNTSKSFLLFSMSPWMIRLYLHLTL
nr:MAG TPA: RNA polymerase Rpb1-like protein [Caudoviricetes sp.]